MRILENRGDEVSEFLKKITKVREKCWEGLSRNLSQGSAPDKTRKVCQREGSQTW